MKLDEIARLTETELLGDKEHEIKGVADLDAALSSDVSFLANPRYLSALQRSKAGAIFIAKSAPREPGRNYLLTENPSQAFQILVHHFYKDKLQKTGFLGIHPSAVIHKSAKIEEGVSIGPQAVIDAHVTIGTGTQIGAHVVIGPHSTIGAHCLIHPHVTIREWCTIGNRVIIQPGAVIGSCGFGFLTDEKGVHIKLEQLGSVVIEDDVEIGANTTIDRARFTETRIGKGTKIDNLVQIAHGVQLGKHNLIVSQVGIAGSTKTGNHVVLAGQAALTGHLTIADGTILAARAALDKSVLEPGGKFAGAPALPLGENNRLTVHFRNLAKYVKRIEALEAKIANLEQKGVNDAPIS